MIHYITTQGLGQPWVGNELSVLQQEAIPFRLHAMRKPAQKLFESRWAGELNRNTEVLYPLPIMGLLSSVLAAPFIFGSEFFSALRNALFGRRENLRARIATFGHLFVACHWARILRREKVAHIHSQWAHSSASIGMYGAWLLGSGFSFTGHAADLFRNRVALEDKINRAEFIICISTFHRQFYLENGARPAQLHVAYCGINPQMFRPNPQRCRPRGPYRILSAGRLVEKKGFLHLIDACAILLKRGASLECVIAGSGEQEPVLRDRVKKLRLGKHVVITGEPLTQERIPGFMYGGDAFVLSCVWAKDNDVDGLPQLTMEAMACGLPVITTNVTGNPDLVINDRTGVLIQPEDPKQLADAIESLMNDPKRAERLAASGRQWVMDQFDLSSALKPLTDLYRLKLGMSVEFERPLDPTAAVGVGDAPPSVKMNG